MILTNRIYASPNKDDFIEFPYQSQIIELVVKTTSGTYLVIPFHDGTKKKSFIPYWVMEKINDPPV